MMNRILLLLTFSSAAFAQWTDFSGSTASTVLSNAMNGKPNFQISASCSTQAGTVGKDYCWDSVVLAYFDVTVSGNPATWVQRVPFSNAGARAALSVNAPITYNSGTGVFGCVVATGSVAGCLSAADFTTFNAKQAAITSGTQDQVLTGSFGLLSLANCTSAGGVMQYSTSTHLSTCHTLTAAEVVGLFSTCSGTQYLGADGACHNASGGATIPSTTNLIKGDNAGNGADSGIAPAAVLQTTAPVITASITVYICPANFTNCAYNGDGGQAATPSDSNTLTQAKSKGTPWATLAHAQSVLDGLFIPAGMTATIQFADTAQTTITDNPLTSGATTMHSAANLTCTNNDFFQAGLEMIQVTAGCGSTTQTIVRNQGANQASQHAAGTGLTRLGVGYVYQPLEVQFSMHTYGAYPYSFIEIGQDPSLTDKYPASYLEIKGNIASPNNVVMTGATTAAGTTVTGGAMVRFMNMNAAVHGFTPMFYGGYQFDSTFQAFQGTINMSGHGELFIDNMGSVGDASSGSVLARTMDQSMGFAGPNLNVVDTGLLYAECCSTDWESHSPAGYMSGSSYVSAKATGTNGKYVFTYAGNESSRIHIWGQTSMVYQSPGQSFLYWTLGNGSLIDNATNGKFGNSSVTITNAAGMTYATADQNGYVYDSCSSLGNTCSVTGNIKQMSAVNTGGHVAAVQQLPADNVDTCVGSGFIEYAPFGSATGQRCGPSITMKGVSAASVTPASGDLNIWNKSDNSGPRARIGSSTDNFLVWAASALASGKFAGGLGNGQIGQQDLVRALSFSFTSPVVNNTGYLAIPFACTISGYDIMLDTGTATIKTWRVNGGTAIPTSGNSISTSGVAIASGTALHSTTTSDWTSTAIAAGDWLAFTVSAVSGSPAFLSFTLECKQ